MNLAAPLDPTILEQTFGLFRLSRMLFAVTSLDIADHLVGGPLDALTLARLTNTHPPSLTSLLDALVGWGVFARTSQNQYMLTPFSQRLVRGSENAANIPLLLGWVGLPATYEAFGDLLHTLRTGQSAFQATHGTGFHTYLSAHPEAGELYTAAMEATADSFANCAAAYDFSGAKLIVDVGGGQGAFALEILSRYPELRSISFDLPDVIAHAKTDGHTAHDRLQLVAGDAFQAVPPGGDIYITSTVLRCFNDDLCLRLLKNIRAAMPPQAKLAAFELLMPDAHDSLAMCQADLTARVLYGGQDRTRREFEELFAQAGLRLVRASVVDVAMHVLEAVPI
jgi:hypothetical protein